jgi:hypothetical protein
MRTDQNKIDDWFRQEIPTLHPAYERAAQLMDGADFPGRSNLVCHACRDICTVIQQFYRVEKTTRADPTTLLNQLDVLWSQENLDDLGRSIASAPESGDPGSSGTSSRSRQSEGPGSQSVPTNRTGSCRTARII